MAVKYDSEDNVEVQMTSLLDCVFLLLIFFLVSSQLKKVEKELPVELPQADVVRTVKATPNLLAISVNQDGEYFLNSKPVGPAGLREAIRNSREEYPDQRVRLNGDIYAPFQSIVHVLDVCKGEGLQVVGIHTAADVPRTAKK